jgi:uncharacterized RDD family membrane protein YckC
MSVNNKQVLVNQIIWMRISFGIGIAITLLLPFPISLVTIIGVFILLNFYMTNRMMRNMGIGIGRVGMSGSVSSSSMSGSTLRYYCMRCETENKLTACPNCGSKMKTVGS